MDAFLEVEEIFGTDLRGNRRLRGELVEWLRHLLQDGARQTFDHFVSINRNQD